MRVCSQIEPLAVDSSTFVPLGSQFLGQYDERTESEGGILYAVPDNTWWAKAVSVGPLCEIEVGQMVLMDKYRGENINFSDGEFTILDEKQALAVRDD